MIVVGESTVQGYPYPSELSFPRQVGCILQKQLPNLTVEALGCRKGRERSFDDPAMAPAME